MSDKIDNKSFVHLHVHSFYSLLDGLSSPKKLVEVAVENGFKALAITDHGCCGGLLVFQKACKDAGIKPLLGCEMYITSDMMFKEKTSVNHHLILLAKNTIGLKSLMRLASIAEIDGKYRKPRIDFAVLEKHHEGLICTSACPNGELSNLLFNDRESEAEALALKYKALFGEDYYIEVMRHVYNEKEQAQEKKEHSLSIKLYNLGNKLGIKVVATNDVHYAKKSDSKYHDILLSIQTIDTVKNPERFTFNSEDFYLKTQNEMLELFKDMPDAVYNTVEIANKIEDNLLKKSDDLLPVFKIPEGFTDEKHYLKELVRDGMRAKGLINKPEYRERIRFEMDLIIKCNYVRYFLILWDILNFAKREKIRVGAGRGSAVGSLCLYVLDVTKLDPIKYGLLFERFINPDRISPPDVDIDFEYFRRSEVVDYVYRKYGQDHCAKIGTFNALKSRAAIRGVSKALDLGRDWNTYQEELKRAKPDPVTGKKEKVELTSEKSLKIADYLAKLVPKGPDVSIDVALRESTEFRDAIARYPDLLDCILHIEKTVAYSGVHAAGIVVCKDPISDHVPLRESKDQICTQLVGPEVEELGLLKFDFLGLKTLTVIDETLKLIKDRHGKDIDIDSLDPVDSKVLSLFNGSYPNMDNRGIFQFESPGISSMLKNIQVDVFEDLIVSNALYRPGPLEANVPDLYADYKHGRKKIVYLHPKMGEILKDTYGCMIFQEDFMKVSQSLAGFTKGQSDTLRKIVGKKKPELIKKEKLDEKFVSGCASSGVSENIAKEIFKQIEYFGGYGFNRSHSAAYSFIAYQTAYLKVYYPIEFMCSLLTSEIDNADKNEKLMSYINEAKRMGIVIMKSNINRSKNKYIIERGTDPGNGRTIENIRSPLTVIDGVGGVASESIINNQPYKNLMDFLFKLNGAKVNIKVFKSLLSNGCFDESWKLKSADAITQYEESRSASGKKKQKSIAKQMEYINSAGDSVLCFGGEDFDIKF